MLAPDNRSTNDKSAAAYAGVVSMDSLSTSCSGVQIAHLIKDPAWLPPVRLEVAGLHQAAAAWRQNRPDVWAPVLLAFDTYIPRFDAFFGAVDSGRSTSADVWLTALREVLLPGLDTCVESVAAAGHLLDRCRADFSAILPRIDRSIAQGWAALAAEEEDMLRLTRELGSLDELVRGLGSTIDSDGISTAKDYVSNVVSLLYDVGTAGAEASVPVLGAVTAVLTLGKDLYDLISENADLEKVLDRITEVTAELTSDALGVALTKSTLQLLYRLEHDFLASKDALPQVVDMWSSEREKVRAAVSSLEAGARPEDYAELQTLPIARASWQSIADFTANLKRSDIAVGRPVTIDIGKHMTAPTLSA